MEEQRYKNALEKARVRYNEIKGTSSSEEKFLLDIFPELAESEDEKIRKALIEYFSTGANNNETTCNIEDKKILSWLEKQGGNLVKNGYTNNKDFIKYADNYSKEIWHKLMDNFKNIKDYHIGCNDVSDIVLNAIIDTCNWLEKQGKQKSADKDDSKYKLSDLIVQGHWIVRDLEAYMNINGDKYDVWCVNYKLDNKYIICDDLNGNRETFTIDEVNEFFSLWDMSYVKPGDILAFDKSSYQYPFVVIYKEQNKEDSNGFDAYCFVNHSGLFCTTNPSSKGFECSNRLHPATKKERELLFSKMSNAGYVWDSENRQLKYEFLF